MNFSNVKIRYGKVNALQTPLSSGEMRAWWGTPRDWAGITFVAANVGITGSSFRLGHELSDRDLPADLQPLLLDGGDAPWVRGRIQRAFLTTVADADADAAEKSGLVAEFVGVILEADGSQVGVPFLCTDYYLRTGLCFSDGEVADVRDRIADAFWGLLLSEPADVAEYRDRMFHYGMGAWIGFGIENGRPFVEDLEEEPEAE